MFAFKKVPLIVLIKSTSVDFYAQSSTPGLKLEMTPNLILNQEVLDQNSLENLIKDFIVKNNLRKHVGIFLILGQGTYYEKTIPASDPENESFEIEKFIEEVPFDPPNIARSIVKSKSEVFAFAAYKNFFYPFVQIFNTLGLDTKAVIPITALGLQDSARGLTQTEIELILKNGNFGKKADFMHREAYNKSRRSTKIAIGAVCALVVITIIVAVTTHLPKSSPSAKPAVSPSKRTQPSAGKKTVSVQPAKKVFDKSAATVMILNGTRREGEAGKVKELMATLGFGDIQTDNAPEQSQTKTQVVVITHVPDDVRNEITNLLKKIFSEVVVVEKATAEATIVVTTGSR